MEYYTHFEKVCQAPFKKYFDFFSKKRKRGCLIKNRDREPLFGSKSGKNSVFLRKPSSFCLYSYVFRKGARQISSRIFRSSPERRTCVRRRVKTEKVNEKKQLIIVFSKCLTKTRRNEARLCRARISTMF